MGALRLDPAAVKTLSWGWSSSGGGGSCSCHHSSSNKWSLPGWLCAMFYYTMHMCGKRPEHAMRIARKVGVAPSFGRFGLIGRRACCAITSSTTRQWLDSAKGGFKYGTPTIHCLLTRQKFGPNTYRAKMQQQRQEGCGLVFRNQGQAVPHRPSEWGTHARRVVLQCAQRSGVARVGGVHTGEL